jgi:hypothetical protein
MALEKVLNTAKIHTTVGWKDLFRKHRLLGWPRV